MATADVRIAEALRRADYMNWSAAEVAEKIDGTVTAICRDAVAARNAEIAEAVAGMHNDACDLVRGAGPICNCSNVNRAAVLAIIEKETP